MTKKKKQASTADRREFIRTSVLDQGKTLAFDELRQSFSVSNTALYADGKYFAKQSEPIMIRDKAFVRSEDHLKLFGRRRQRRHSEKDVIGRMAANIILRPLGSEEPQHQPESNTDFESNAASLLKQPSNSKFHMADDLNGKLMAYWNKPHRVAVLDSGSTTETVARHISEVRTPDPKHHLASLEILTNGLMIMNALKNSTHGIITVGGNLRSETEATAGILADWCLKAWQNLEPDIAIIGTTNLNERYDFCCDSIEEAVIKSTLLHIARIRCIVADSHKLISFGGSSYAFATFSRSQVDIIITDTGILNTRDNPAQEQVRSSFLDRARKSGIFVLVANPS
ncbi:MAG: sugar phosphate isomerase family [Planctomycetota bacterium]|jgi:DeoR/GlpR family transcriptional regulator of sugar metabolism